MKRLTDLTSYKGVLPSASEMFGIYQPLLGWKSMRMQHRIDHGVRSRLGEVLGRLTGSIQPNYTARFAAADCTLSVEGIGAGTFTAVPSFAGVIATQIASELPPRDQYKPEVWSKFASAKFLDTVLKERVAPAAVDRYRQLCSIRAANRAYQGGAHAEVVVRALLDRESRTAGLLQSLAKNGHFGVLEQMFYGQEDKKKAMWDLLAHIEDPFTTIDPSHDLSRVGLSPVGIAHLFREYFFELDTFLGTPVGHVWLAPGATVELIEIQTRRRLDRAVASSSRSRRRARPKTQSRSRTICPTR